MHTRSFPKFFLHGLALVGGLALGCVITTGEDECPGLNNHESGNQCFCDAGYEWANPNDPNDLTCVQAQAKDGDCTEANNVIIGGECFCDDQYTWCSDDPNDFSCCFNGGHEGGGETQGDSGDDLADTGDTAGTGTDTGTGDTGIDDTGPDPDTGVEPDPADCTEDGLNFCSNTEDQGPEGSRVWVCTSGEWVENDEIADESCMFDGFDFAYGCVGTDTAVQFVCGDGPGTPCEGDTASCIDEDIINYCAFGKLTEDSCLRICMEDGDDMGVTYDHGQCDARLNECFCCDEGEEGCNV